MTRLDIKLVVVVVLMPILVAASATVLWKHYRPVDYSEGVEMSAGVSTHSAEIPVSNSNMEKHKTTVGVLSAEAGKAHQSTQRAPLRSLDQTLTVETRSGDVPLPPPERRSRHGSLDQAIERVWASPNVEAQIAAMRDLANFPDPRTLDVLGPALQSQVPQVRKVALEVMRDVTVYDPAILAEVRNSVTGDSSAEVQYAALEVMVRYDEGPEARKVLEELVTDPKGVYRDYALRELERLDYEADARSRPDLQLQQALQAQAKPAQ